MRPYFLSVVLGLGAAGPIVAQTNCLDQVKFPEVGRWAEYNARSGNDAYTIRYGVIGSEARDGKKFRWVQMQMTGARKDKNLVYQMLVPAAFAEMEEVQEVIFKPGDKPAMKISGPMLGMIRAQLNQQSFLEDLCRGVTLVGKESTTVPAGKFETLHFHSTEHAADSWVSTQVPFSMVKASGKKYQLELAAHGKGAKSAITEQPREMGGMGGRPN